MFALPFVIPLTTPAAFTVATPVLLLLHVPPNAVLLNVIVAPMHTFVAPIIPEGAGVTMNVYVAGVPQPVL